MSLLLALHAGVTWALVGLIWTVQVVHYPLLARVGRDAFAGVHAAHMRRMTWVVAPLMLAEAATAVLLVARPPPGTCPPLPWVGLLLVVVVWLSTAFLQVPAHARLERGFDPRVHRFLVRTNWVRTLAWSARGVLLLLLSTPDPFFK